MLLGPCITRIMMMILNAKVASFSSADCNKEDTTWRRVWVGKDREKKGKCLIIPKSLKPSPSCSLCDEEAWAATKHQSWQRTSSIIDKWMTHRMNPWLITPEMLVYRPKLNACPAAYNKFIVRLHWAWGTNSSPLDCKGVNEVNNSEVMHLCVCESELNFLHRTCSWAHFCLTSNNNTSFCWSQRR